MAIEQNADGYKHDAFICYSRRNEEFAQKLEDTAESFIPPNDLPVPQRYLDFFRDKRDFAAGDYHKNRDEHLKNSRKLIVICSPTARKSKYVNDEIEQFVKFNDVKNIIPILVSGIPNNEAAAGQEDQLTFPEELCKVMPMPLAINYLNFDTKKHRITKGLYADSWFALLASIYDLRRAEVEQREKRRRARIRSITFSILGGSIAVLSALLVLVWISREEAIDRKLLSEATGLDAQASQMFAESRRAEAQRELEIQRLYELEEDFEITELENYGANDSLRLRLINLSQEIDQTKRQLEILAGHSKESLRGGKAYLADADVKWLAIREKRESWITNRSPPSLPTLFSLELLNTTDEGKCMILHYGDVDDPKFIVIGGGLYRNYKNTLGPRLQEIKNSWNPSKALPLEIVIAAEMDIQSIGGLIAMTDSLLHQQKLNTPSSLDIQTIWYNSFQPELKRWQKARLSLNAKQLDIPKNTPFDYFIMRPDSGAVVVDKGPLKITVINPYPKRLSDLRDFWVSTVEKMTDSTIKYKMPVEKFSNKALRIAEAPAVGLDSVMLRGYRDRSVVNLASICLVFELSNTRILFTGDAVADDILKGLHAAGYLSDKGTTHMDVMILPHSASDLNVSKDFFKHITADNYIIFGDGTHNNPEVKTLKMLEEARAQASMTMYFVNRDGRNNHGNKLDRYFLDNGIWAKQHRRVFRRFNERSLIVNLLEPMRY